jgi:Ser/Thr protein kinase RdoA (MazF antagonist)
MTDSGHPFDELTPDVILDAVEQRGYLSDGRMLALNSYENRVYQVGVEDGTPLVAKFYRPERWSDDQIREEHSFSRELVSHELPVVAPLVGDDGESLFHHQGFRVALFPRRGGHPPELDNMDHLHVLGRHLAILHNVGAVRPFQYRPTLDIQSYGHDSVAFCSEHFVPADLRDAWQPLTRDLLAAIEDIFASVDNVDWIRVHGDFHPGNLLWRDDAPNFIDLDDARMAPAVQDIFMLLSGERDEQLRQLSEIMDGYSEFRDFNPAELRLVEALRTLRMLYFSAWIGRRWHDPAFPRAFPWFNSSRYWGEMILDLKMQMSALNEPPLQIL